MVKIINDLEYPVIINGVRTPHDIRDGAEAKKMYAIIEPDGVHFFVIKEDLEKDPLKEARVDSTDELTQVNSTGAKND